MAQPTTTPKIEELRARLKAEPKSRQFFPLAEELRKIDRFDEAEKVLREGLANHPAYLSAWISLGRVLHEAARYKDAVDVLEKALSLDQGNVVAARLLAESYLAIGEKVEAIKKFKLLNAILPNDEETEARIDALDRELNPSKYGGAPSIAPAVPPPPPASAPPPAPEPAAPAAPLEPEVTATPPPTPEPPTAAPPIAPTPESPLLVGVPPADADDVFSASAVTNRQELFGSTESDDVFAPETRPVEEPSVPRRPSPDETSPFAPAPKFPEDEDRVWSAPDTPQQPEEPSSPFDDLPPAPPSMPAFEMAEPLPFSPAASAPAPSEPETHEAPEKAPDEDLTTTTTMADLYAKQGHYDQAREIYERMLERDPTNRDLRQKLDALPGAAGGAPAETEGERNQAVTRLSAWLSKVKKDDRRV